jgi:hypothetical protein
LQRLLPCGNRPQVATADEANHDERVCDAELDDEAVSGYRWVVAALSGRVFTRCIGNCANPVEEAVQRASQSESLPRASGQVGGTGRVPGSGNGPLA